MSLDFADMGLFAVDTEKECALYELRDALTYPLGCSLALAEDDAVVSITHERKTTPFKFAVKFRKHYVAKYGSQWSALRYIVCGLLILMPDHNPCVEILVYQRYDLPSFMASPNS